MPALDGLGDAALAARHATVAAVAEEVVPAHRAQPGVVHLRDAGGAQLVAGDDVEREVALAHAGVVAGEVGVHLLAHLVAARPRRGPEGRGHGRVLGQAAGIRMWDPAQLTQALTAGGFTAIRRRSYGFMQFAGATLG